MGDDAHLGTEARLSTLRDRHGKISPGNESINETIYWFAEHLPGQVADKYLAKIKRQYRSAAGEHAERAGSHTYREGLTGGYLARQGYKVDYDRNVDGKTPDWTLLDASDEIVALVESVMHEPGRGSNTSRIADKLRHKVGAYAGLIRSLQIPFVVAVFPAFATGVYPDEVATAATQTFPTEPELSGVIFIEEDGRLGYRGHSFEFFKNPNPNHSIHLPAEHLAWKKGETPPVVAIKYR